MKRLSKFLRMDWESFFKNKGIAWRNKDYKYLESVFPLSDFEGTLLDVGCGLGDGLVYLRPKCKNVTKYYGADFSNNAIRVCRSNSILRHVTFFQHNINDNLTGKYDNIISLQTLEHVKKPVLAMKNLINATNKLLIVSTPYRNKRPDRDHMWSFDENDFTDLLDFYCFGQNRTNIFWIWRKK